MLTVEKVCSILCALAGTVFLFIAISGFWHYFFLMGFCYAVAIMVYEDECPGGKTGRKR